LSIKVSPGKSQYSETYVDHLWCHSNLAKLSRRPTCRTEYSNFPFFNL
jgi:hypothetical protein